MNLFARARISVFKTLITSYKIRVRPNENNQIKAQVMRTKNVDDSDSAIKDIRLTDTVGSYSKTLDCCYSCFGDCFRMDKKIVKLSFGVLEKVRCEQDEEDEREQLRNKLNNIEIALDNITQKLNSFRN